MQHLQNQRRCFEELTIAADSGLLRDYPRFDFSSIDFLLPAENCMQLLAHSFNCKVHRCICERKELCCLWKWTFSISVCHRSPSVQDRDGYKGQVETLRDKVSLLSRDLTDHQDSTSAKSDRILSLEHELQRAEAALASHQSKLAETEGELHSSRSEIADQHAKFQALQDELEETNNAYARAEKSWLNEKQILCHVCTPVRILAQCTV